MAEISPILDYAGPKPRSRLRLASNSDIKLYDEGATLKIVETLRGKGEAIGAICFSGITFLLLLLSSVPNSGVLTFPPTWLLLPSVLIGPGLYVMVLVIQNTWRRTEVDVTSEKLTLKFFSAFNNRSYAWPSELLTNVILEPISEFEAEIVIMPHFGGEARLFGGHSTRELASLAERMRQILNVPRIMAPLVTAQLAMDAGTPDEPT